MSLSPQIFVRTSQGAKVVVYVCVTTFRTGTDLSLPEVRQWTDRQKSPPTRVGVPSLPCRKTPVDGPEERRMVQGPWMLGGLCRVRNSLKK